jgi:hypothetical protein
VCVCGGGGGVRAPGAAVGHTAFTSCKRGRTSECIQRGIHRRDATTHLVLDRGDGTLGAPVDGVGGRAHVEEDLVALGRRLDGDLGAEHHRLELVVGQVAELVDAHEEGRLALAVTAEHGVRGGGRGDGVSMCEPSLSSCGRWVILR